MRIWDGKEIDKETVSYSFKFLGMRYSWGHKKVYRKLHLGECAITTSMYTYRNIVLN